jgi:hypothetical protein
MQAHLESELVPFSALPALCTGLSLNQRRRHIRHNRRSERDGAAVSRPSACISGWVVVLVAILQRRPTVALRHDTSLATSRLSPGSSG